MCYEKLEKPNQSVCISSKMVQKFLWLCVPLVEQSYVYHDWFVSHNMQSSWDLTTAFKHLIVEKITPWDLLIRKKEKF